MSNKEFVEQLQNLLNKFPHLNNDTAMVMNLDWNFKDIVQVSYEIDSEDKKEFLVISYDSHL